ncbi:hypothetical protein ACU5EH_24785 [Aliivibrio salmonicida]|uniref:hypothetical protein n=1 Tax=Aliivibrio salmonicida TaxID=40269 RepID=UPI00406C06BD
MSIYYITPSFVMILFVDWRIAMAKQRYKTAHLFVKNVTELGKYLTSIAIRFESA